MILEIPTSTDAARYDLEVELDGREFRLLFDWNERDQAWQLSLFNAAGVELLSGIRVVVNYPLIGRFRDPDLPPGDLSAVDTGTTGADPGFADLGDRVRLIYTPIADFPAIFLS